MPSHNTHHNYRIPAYMGTTYSDIIRWCHTFFQEAPPHLAALGIAAADFAAAKDAFETFRTLFTCRDNVVNYGKEITQQLHDLMFSRSAVAVPVAPPNLGPAAAFDGLGGFIATINEWWVRHVQPAPGYTAELGKLLGFVKGPAAAPDLLSLSPAAAAKFTGGAVMLHGHLPRPARYWHLLVDRNDGRGKVELALIAGAQFADHHPLPDKPTAWTYTVELRDKDQYALGKVSVVSVTVWRGAADQGPEA